MDRKFGFVDQQNTFGDLSPRNDEGVAVSLVQPGRYIAASV